jgi:hypothetical protein
VHHFYAMKRCKLYFIAQLLFSFQCIAQNKSFDVFTYQAPEFFAMSELGSRVEFNLTNNDTSFCNIRLYKSRYSQAHIKKQINDQWSEYVVTRFAEVDKKPQRILTEQYWDGWTSTIAIGNFYEHKRKCVIMLNSFARVGQTAFVVFAFTDKSFKEPVELFSKQLHLKKEK